MREIANKRGHLEMACLNGRVRDMITMDQLMNKTLPLPCTSKPPLPRGIIPSVICDCDHGRKENSKFYQRFYKYGKIPQLSIFAAQST